MQSFGRWLFRYRNRAFPVVILALIVCFPPHLFGGSLQTDAALDAVGLALALLGQALRIAVVGFAYIKRGGRNKRVHADTLVTEGIFAHSRNPLYVGNILILMGLFVIHHNLMVYALGGLFFGFGYFSIVRTEEAFLAAKFQQAYMDYCAHVPRWLPRLQGIRHTLADMTFNWRRVAFKELPSAVVWWITAMGLLLNETWQNQSPLETGRLVGAACAVSVAIALLLAARFLKSVKPAIPNASQP